MTSLQFLILKKKKLPYQIRPNKYSHCMSCGMTRKIQIRVVSVRIKRWDHQYWVRSGDTNIYMFARLLASRKGVYPIISNIIMLIVKLVTLL